MSKIAVSCVCLGLIVFVSVPAESENADAAQAKAAAATAQAEASRTQALTSHFDSQRALTIENLTQSKPDLKIVGKIALVLSRTKNEQTNKYDHSFEVVNVPPDVTAAYRTNSEGEDRLQNQVIQSYKAVPLDDMVPFIEVQFTWCGPYEGNPKRKVCTDAEKNANSYPAELCPPGIKGKEDTKWKSCTVDAIYSENLFDSLDNLDPWQSRSLTPVFVLSENQFLIADDLFRAIRKDPVNFPTFTINDVEVQEYLEGYNKSIEAPAKGNSDDQWTASFGARSGWSSVRNYVFERYPAAASCRPYNTVKGAVSISVTRPETDPVNLLVDNGIVPDPPKVYDVYTLRQMLSQTATQLSTLSGFNSASITAALTNLQGITSTSSFLNAQATNVSAASVTTATPSVPAALTPSPLAAPTNTGESASDLLTDQVQLNAQITSLQLALQGALSDQYILSGNKSVGTRQQTTLGFNVGIDPPRRYKHALAEVRIWVFPAQQSDEISIVNLLPAAKTYNVAKITSSQKQFGAGVVISPINIGVAGGKAKNRLYIAKDTDTLAVQYSVDNLQPTVAQWPDRGRHWSGSPWYQNQVIPNTWPKGAKPIGRSAQEAVADLVPALGAFQIVANACDQDPGPYLLPEDPANTPTPLVFGWQFRPVLGANYVQAGIRTVIAQLALPVGLGAQYAPRVFVQTRWRDYSEKNQVVGGVYPGTCSIEEVSDPIQIVSPLKVKRVEVDDMTGGVLKVVAEGTFLSNGFSVLSGQSAISPVIFNGKNIQFFGSAASLLATDDLSIKAEDGVLTPVAVNPIAPGKDTNECGFTNAYLHATPRPDGTSVVEAVIQSGERFKLKDDGEPKPLFLIGTQVYGLHETPFLEPPRGACRPTSKDGGFSCTYRFLAPTDTLRAAESYTVRDLSWVGMKKSGKIEFDPSFTALTLLANAPAPATNPNAPALPPVYTVSGNDFAQLRSNDEWGCRYRSHNCLDVYQGLTPVPLSAANFQVASKTTALLSINPPLPAPFISTAPAACSTAKKTSTVQTPAQPKAPGTPGSSPGAPGSTSNGAQGASSKPAQSAPANGQVTQGTAASGAAPAPVATTSSTTPKAPVVPVKPAQGAANPPPATKKTTTTNPNPFCDNPSDQISITDANSSATIFYTKDGQPPDRTLTHADTLVYDKPFKVDANREKINAIAVSQGQVVSEPSYAVIVQTSDQSDKAFVKDPKKNPGKSTASYKAVAMTTATAGQLNYKSYRFVWHPGYGEPVEWDLPVPPAAAPAVTASAILNESDSTEITFSNIQIQPSTPANQVTFLFDGAPVQNAVFKYDPVGMTMKVLITSVMTAKPGHKELLLNGFTLAPGSVTLAPVQIELPFDVTKR
jgi:hypothetical protein